MFQTELICGIICNNIIGGEEWNWREFQTELICGIICNLFRQVNIESYVGVSNRVDLWYNLQPKSKSPVALNPLFQTELICGIICNRMAN